MLPAQRQRRNLLPGAISYKNREMLLAAPTEKASWLDIIRKAYLLALSLETKVNRLYARVELDVRSDSVFEAVELEFRKFDELVESEFSSVGENQHDQCELVIACGS